MIFYLLPQFEWTNWIYLFKTVCSFPLYFYLCVSNSVFDWSPACMHTNCNCTREIPLFSRFKISWSLHIPKKTNFLIETVMASNNERLTFLLDQVVYSVVVFYSDAICLCGSRYISWSHCCLHCVCKQLMSPSAYYDSSSMNIIILSSKYFTLPVQYICHQAVPGSHCISVIYRLLWKPCFAMFICSIIYVQCMLW